MPSARRVPSPFPPSFLFGVATADHQCEAYLPEFEDIRDVWERVRDLVPRGQATDFWERYPEDIELAKRLGCRLFRFSIAWSRVEPRPGEWNLDALNHYREMVQAIRAPPRWTTTTPIPIAGHTPDASLCGDRASSQYPSDAAPQ